jgi:hypothetical protein
MFQRAITEPKPTTKPFVKTATVVVAVVAKLATGAVEPAKLPVQGAVAEVMLPVLPAMEVAGIRVRYVMGTPG